ncbi:ion transporter [Shewanella intestini]|uniref:Ion transporter n=1 Tax=Shewanella intestini TaxID=2017544 RepID=A0ABS5I139_9GAMM|nr:MULTISPECIES: ion transporter [Shewanella]MBR9727732.1 ion transporter [Shewanella intestini]MRG35118.1 ion transporter [Shewanella sp. XMDDZSB0408]
MIDTPKWSSRIRVIGPSPIELAMMVLSLVSVILVLTMTFVTIESETYRLLLVIDTFICLIFLVRFFVGLYKSSNRRHYFKHQWIDLVASIPAIEPLRFARIFQILRVIRLIRSSRSLIFPLLSQRRQTTLASLLLAMVLILAFSSILILLVESNVEGANITTAEQAIWWALVTISTVGYGDYYPVTTAGHVIGGLVILSGVSFFGVISGYMASVFVAPDESQRQESHQAEIKSELDKALERMEKNQLQMEQNQQIMLTEIASLKNQLNQTQSKAKS